MFMYVGARILLMRAMNFFSKRQAAAAAAEYFSHYVKNESTVLEGGPRRG